MSLSDHRLCAEFSTLAPFRQGPELRSTASIVVVPSATRGAVADERLRRRLSRGRVGVEEPAAETLIRVLAVLGRPPPSSGLAALRYFGQTGQHAAGWIAAADPVHLETRLRHLVVRRLSEDDVSPSELAELFETLQARLGHDAGLTFTAAGDWGYVGAASPFATPDMSADMANGRLPDHFAAAGDSTGYHRLLSEVQMVLHDHAVNQRRQAGGRLPINSLWFWGGGESAAARREQLPTLIADDPLFNGHWTHEHCVTAPAAAANQRIPPGQPPFVYVSDHAADGLEIAWRSVCARAVDEVVVVSTDGLNLVLRPRDRFRFWRAVSPVLEEPASDA